MSKTIAAISSGQMPAAIGVIRLTGDHALQIIQSCLHRKTLVPRMMHSRVIYNDNDEAIDDVLVCYFKGPRSFTGEDCVEIFAHGGLVNLARVLETVCTFGAVPAEPGEFSKRAFLNGKLDLSQAEAIMDMIHAQNVSQCREAHRQLSGTLAQTVNALRESLMQLLCALEATIDFSTEEELAPLPEAQIRTTSAYVMDQLMRMRRAHEQYRAGGIKTVLAGRPNAGKSSLFNRLIGHDRAIVTDIAGTTTDTLEASLTLRHLLFSLIDTAGITETQNPIERIGVERAKQQIQNADILLILIDGTDPDDGIFKDLEREFSGDLSFLSNHHVILIRSKADLFDCIELPQNIQALCERHQIPVVDVSVVSREGMQALEDILVRLGIAYGQGNENVTLVTSQRHISQIRIAESAIARAQESLDTMMPAECIAADLREAADALALITGAIASEDVINEIFSHFCIGK